MVDELEVDEVGLDELVVDEVKNRPSGCRRGARLPYFSYLCIRCKGAYIPHGRSPPFAALKMVHFNSE